MLGVQTCIQHSHHHTGAVIARFCAVEDTGRLVEVHRVLHQLSLCSLIDLADNGAFTLIQGLADCLKVTGQDLDLKAAEQNAVIQAAKYGINISGATLYCTHQPCVICAKIINLLSIEFFAYGNAKVNKSDRLFFSSSGRPCNTRK